MKDTYLINLDLAFRLNALAFLGFVRLAFAVGCTISNIHFIVFAPTKTFVLFVFDPTYHLV